MVRRAKRTRADQRRTTEQPGDGVHHGRLQRLVEGERGQDAAEPLGQHRLARAGRTDEQQVVPARCRDLQRPPRHLLAAHVAEVGRGCGCARGGAWNGGDRRSGGRLAAEEGDQIPEVARRLNLAPAHRRRLAGVLGRNDQPPHLLSARPGGDRQDPAHRTQRSVERQLAHEQRARQCRRVDDARRAEHPDGDGDVIRGAVLAEIGGRQVDGDPARRQLEAAVLQRAADPDAPLAHPGVRQPDDVAAGEADRHVDLDVDRSGFDSHHGCGGDTREHAAGYCQRSASPRPRFPAVSGRARGRRSVMTSRRRPSCLKRQAQAEAGAEGSLVRQRLTEVRVLGEGPPAEVLANFRSCVVPFAIGGAAWNV